MGKQTGFLEYERAENKEVPAKERIKGYSFYAPLMPLCGDNGRMIASQGYFELLDGNTADMTLNGYANMEIDYR